MDAYVQNLIVNKISAGKLRFVAIGGGSINETYRMDAQDHKYFCKINSVQKFPHLFEKEKRGLSFLRSAQSISVPKLIWQGEVGDKQILILEWIEQGLRTKAFWKKFGEELAKLHLRSGGNHQTIMSSG